MARITPITNTLQPEMHLMAMRRIINFEAEFIDFVEEAFAASDACLKAAGMLPTGSPVALFYSLDLTRLDVAVGFPVAHSIEGTDTVGCIMLPPQTAVVAIDQGPYEAQDATLDELFDWVRDQGFIHDYPLRYDYLNDTERPPETFLTEIVIPYRER